jgi:hypothetical protein
VSIDDAIRAAEEAAQKLREALDVLEREATAELGFAPCSTAKMRERVGDISLGGLKRELAEARRPRGPMVTLEWTGGGKPSRSVEVVRRTAAQVVVVDNPVWGGTAVFKLSDGTPARRSTDSWFGVWRISEADLEAVRAMPVGENAVSRALKAIETGRYDEVNR